MVAGVGVTKRRNDSVVSRRAEATYCKTNNEIGGGTLGGSIISARTTARTQERLWNKRPFGPFGQEGQEPAGGGGRRPGGYKRYDG